MAAREIDFAGIEPVTVHVAGPDISTQTVLSPVSGSTRLIMQALDQDVYYTLDGTTPIATGSVVGFLMTADAAEKTIHLTDKTIITVVEATGTANLQYQWCK